MPKTGPKVPGVVVVVLCLKFEGSALSQATFHLIGFDLIPTHTNYTGGTFLLFVTLGLEKVFLQ